MIEAELEKRIVDGIAGALTAAGLDAAAFDLRGMWQTAAEGAVKGAENAAPVILRLAVSPRAFDSYALPEVTFTCALSVVFRADLDAAGARVHTVCGALADLLAQWHTARAPELDVDGFAVHGFQSLGGTPPAWHADAATWSAVFNFAIVGRAAA